LDRCCSLGIAVVGFIEVEIPLEGGLGCGVERDKAFFVALPTKLDSRYSCLPNKVGSGE